MIAKRRMPQRNTDSTQRLAEVYTKLRQISVKAKAEPGLRFTSLAHLLTTDLLDDSFQRLRKKAAAGVDGVTWWEYECGIVPRLEDLHSRLKDGQYRAQPVRRVYLEKEGGKRRPLGIPATEDKVVQRATVTILEAIYEQDFYPCSYGFRPGRGAHGALDELARLMYSGKVNYVIDADISSYFDTVVHEHLREFMRRRVADPHILQLIGKWLKAGVIDDGQLLVSQAGTPQGSVISPLLANVYLHYVLDEWWHQEVTPRLRGEAHVIRYADDGALTFTHEEDALKMMEVLSKRFARFGLALHPEKTKLMPFGRCALWQLKKAGRLGSKTGSFDFLGFTHYFGRSLKGSLAYRIRTMAKRLNGAVKRVTQWCRYNRHLPLREQWKHLKTVLTGHYNYYGRSTNYDSLKRFYRVVQGVWYKWLRRRSQRKHLSTARYRRILDRYPLPKPQIKVPVRVFAKP